MRLHPTLQGNGFLQVMAGEWIPHLSSFINAEVFFKVGGYHPGIINGEDVDLCRRIALHGNFAGMPAVVGCVRLGPIGIPTDDANARYDSRMGREAILQMPGVFKHMHGSATSSSWYGRMVRIYITSAIWNIRRKRLFTALSRLCWVMVSLSLGLAGVLSPGFWHALTHAYQSETFAREARVSMSVDNKNA